MNTLFRYAFALIMNPKGPFTNTKRYQPYLP